MYVSTKLQTATIYRITVQQKKFRDEEDVRLRPQVVDGDLLAPSLPSS